MELKEKTLKSEPVFDGRVINLRVDTVTLPDGNASTREVIAHPGGVCVVAVDDEKNVYMVRQYRYPTKQVLLEIPAGKLEYGEDHFEAAKRELEEEAGVIAENYVYLGYFYPTPAYCEEKIHMYFASGLTKTKQNLDDEEFLEVEKIPFAELLEMIGKGEIIDGKTALAALRAKEYITGERNYGKQ